MSKKQPKVTLVLDGQGRFLVESTKAALRLNVVESDDGGIYFEVVAERGRFPGFNERARTNLMNGVIAPEADV